MHHIISDGWSIEIIRSEFLSLYEAYQNKDKPEPISKPPAIQYRDFAVWQNTYISNPGLKSKARQYWKTKMEQGFPVLRFPYIAGGSIEDRSGAFYRCTVNQQIKEKLQRMAAQNNTTLFMVLFSMYNVLMSFLSGQDEVVTSVISAGRPHISLYDIVGYFINQVIVKIDVNLDEDFVDFLPKVSAELLEAFQYQDYPFELILDEMRMEPPKVTTAFNFLNMQDISIGQELASVESYHSEKWMDVKFVVTLYLKEFKNGIELGWEYQESLITKDIIEDIARNYIKLMDEITQEPPAIEK